MQNNVLGQALGAAALATGAGSAAGEPGSPTSESSGEEGPLTDGEPDVAFVGERSGPSDPVQVRLPGITPRGQAGERPAGLHIACMEAARNQLEYKIQPC